MVLCNLPKPANLYRRLHSETDGQTFISLLQLIRKGSAWHNVDSSHGTKLCT